MKELSIIQTKTFGKSRQLKQTDRQVLNLSQPDIISEARVCLHLTAHMTGLRYDSRVDWNIIRYCQWKNYENMTQKDGLSSKHLIWYKTKLHIEKKYFIATHDQLFLYNGIEKEVTILLGRMDFRGIHPQDPRRQLKRQPEKLLKLYIKFFHLYLACPLQS